MQCQITYVAINFLSLPRSTQREQLRAFRVAAGLSARAAAAAWWQRAVLQARNGTAPPNAPARPLGRLAGAPCASKAALQPRNVNVTIAGTWEAPGLFTLRTLSYSFYTLYTIYPFYTQCCRQKESRVLELETVLSVAAAASRWPQRGRTRKDLVQTMENEA
ncbi:hypothetical protein EK904_013504 [Melospiza melodia maxima]|nr:hypothetical protein EK904_013504 [Melospiza melodia maxima]